MAEEERSLGRAPVGPGPRVVGYEDDLRIGVDIDPQIRDTIQLVQPFTATTPHRINALCEAVRYVIRADIPGAFVECGVWRGGSMMAVAHTLLQLGATDRDLFLYDTFGDIPPPREEDVRFDGVPAAEEEGVARWHDAEWFERGTSVDEVRENLRSVGYPMDRVRFVRGLVEETIPSEAPDTAAIVRLDTDWYRSTRHELIHLVPRIPSGGILLIDDYGYYRGCRRAVDEYFSEFDRPVFLNRIDFTGRLAVIP